VLVTGDPEIVTPQNIALAYNVECTSCDTFASAYQYVLGTDENVRFTPEGRHQIQEIRRELRELAQAGLPLTELDTRLNALMQRLAKVLRTELVAAGKPEDGDQNERAPPTTTTTTTPTETAPTTPTTTETAPTTTTDTTTTP
jgi:hypothetical protein